MSNIASKLKGSIYFKLAKGIIFQELGGPGWGGGGGGGGAGGGRGGNQNLMLFCRGQAELPGAFYRIKKY